MLGEFSCPGFWENALSRNCDRLQRGIGLGYGMIFFLKSTEKPDFFRYYGIFHHCVRCLYETEPVHPGISGKGDYQADIGPFGCLYGAYSAIMGGMHIPDFKTGPLPCESSWPQSGKPAFVCGFRERVGLIHELGKLAGAEKLLDHRRHRLGVHEIIGHEGIHLLKTHSFTDGPLHAHQSDPVLIFQQFPHCPDPPVPQMVYVIHRALGISEPYQGFHCEQDILPPEGSHTHRNINTQPEIQLHAAHS